VLGGEDARQLERVVELAREVLGPDLCGAYLFGSAVLGGLRPASDLDLLAVSTRATTPDEKRRLVEQLLSISGRRTPEGRWRRVELTVVVASEVRPWRFPPRFDLQYGDWLRGDFERGEIEPWPTTVNPDLAVLLTMVLLADRPLLGPPPAEVLDPVPHADVVRAMADGIDPLLEELDTDARNVVLTLARIWSTVVTREIRSKDARRTARSRSCPRSTGPCSRAPGRSTSAMRRSSGTTSQTLSAPTPNTSRARSVACAGRHLVDSGRRARHPPGLPYSPRCRLRPGGRRPMSTRNRAQRARTAAVPRTGLACLECGADGDDRAHGWQAFLADGIEFPRAQVLVYCPSCADREFGAGASRPSTPSR